MTNYLDWMQRHRVFNAILVILYYVAVVLPHKKFGTFLNKNIFVGSGKKEMRDHYNEQILIVAGIILLIGLIFYIRSSLQHDSKIKLWGYMAANILFAGLAIKFLFVNNVEIIHFPQYACFAILIFPFTMNYTSTLVWTTIAGAIDEAYQNFYLAPLDTGYYDWNDVITNLIGAVFGLLLIRIIGIERKKFDSFWKTSAFYGIVSLMALVLLLNLFGLLSMGPDPDYPYHMVSKQLDGFWQALPLMPEIIYHVVRPLEGLVMTFVLWGFYSKIGD